MSRSLRYAADGRIARALTAADPELGAVIALVGDVEAPLAESGFEAIAQSIVWQQLSGKAGQTVWRRLRDVVGTSPRELADAPAQALRAVGLSNRKADHIRRIARATLAGEMDWEGLSRLDDEQVVRALLPLPGVGRWTAEMYLIFALGRPDVLALDDFGIRRSAGLMLGLGRPLGRSELAERGERWRPWRTAASLWLWEYPNVR